MQILVVASCMARQLTENGQTRAEMQRLSRILAGVSPLLVVPALPSSHWPSWWTSFGGSWVGPSY